MLHFNSNSFMQFSNKLNLKNTVWCVCVTICKAMHSAIKNQSNPFLFMQVFDHFGLTSNFGSEVFYSDR